jgi:hypothetical protein
LFLSFTDYKEIGDTYKIYSENLKGKGQLSDGWNDSIEMELDLTRHLMSCYVNVIVSV